MTTQAKLTKADLQALKTKQQVYDAIEQGKITFAEARPRLDELERAESTSAYSVKLGSTGRFFVSGPACSQSLTAGQVLGVLTMKDKIVAIAKQHASAKPRLEELKNLKGEKYGAWFQGDINVASESTSNADGINTIDSSCDLQNSFNFPRFSANSMSAALGALRSIIEKQTMLACDATLSATVICAPIGIWNPCFSMYGKAFVRTCNSVNSNVASRSSANILSTVGGASVSLASETSIFALSRALSSIV